MSSNSRLIDTLGLTGNDLATLFNSLGITSEDEKESIKWVMSNADWEKNPKMRRAVAHTGFDARAIVHQFLVKCSANKSGKDGEKITVGETEVYKKNDFNSDLQFFINTFLQRGNNVKKMLLKMDQSTAAVLKSKLSSYGINTESKETNLKSDTLTLARIAQAFPLHTAAVIQASNLQGKLQSRVFGTVSNIPVMMTHSIFSGLIPSTGDISQKLREIAVVLNIEMSIMLSDPKTKRKMMASLVEDLAENSRLYVDAAMNGGVVADAAKVKVLMKAGVISLSDSLTMPVDLMSLKDCQ